MSVNILSHVMIISVLCFPVSLIKQKKKTSCGPGWDDKKGIFFLYVLWDIFKSYLFISCGVIIFSVLKSIKAIHHPNLRQQVAVAVSGSFISLCEGTYARNQISSRKRYRIKPLMCFSESCDHLLSFQIWPKDILYCFSLHHITFSVPQWAVCHLSGSNGHV